MGGIQNISTKIKTRVSTLFTLFNTGPEVLAKTIKQKKQAQGFKQERIL